MDLRHAPENPAPRRYNAAQLGKLLELANTVQCECPNHVAKLVTSLNQFEDYERGCVNRNEADRRVHEQLYELTVKARTLMEEALTLVIAHDKLEL